MRRVSSSSDGGATADSTYAYNAAGEVVSMTDRSGTSTYTRNKNGLLTSVVDGGGEQLGYERDAVGRVVKMTYPGDRDVAYQYDAVGQMTGLTDWLGRAWQYEWTSMGEVSRQTNPNGTSESRAYDELGRLTQMTLAAGTTETLDYAYNAAGELLSEQSSGTSFAPFDYEFDLKGQLTEANSDGVPQSFEASPNAALLANGTNGVLARNDRQQLETRTAPDQSAVEFVHDSNGSRTTETTRLVGEIEPASIVSYEYGPEGGLTGYTREGAEPVDVTYITDGDGLRQSRTSAGVTSEFLWNVISDAPLLISDTAHDFVYGPLTTPVAQVDKASGQIDYLHSDLIGSVRWISSATGAIIASQQFDAYGSRKGGVGVVASAIGFTGAWTDPDTQLVYLRSRDLDPASGQFITVDPAVATTHEPYAYASANPVQNVDPTGRSPQSGAGTTSGDRPTSDSVWWQAVGIGAVASVVAVRASLRVTAACRAAALTFMSYAGTAEGQVILGWALGFATPEMHYGSDTGLVAHLQGMKETVDPQQALRVDLAAGVALVGRPLESGYDAGTPGLGNDSFRRDMLTYSHWASASNSDRVYAALGSYELDGTVTRIDERCRIATVLYLGFNDTTLGSAAGPTEEIKSLLNEFAESTGVLSKVRQTFSWTQYVRY
jgi:RHS repeat-associated protein